MPWLYEGDFIDPTRDNALPTLEYRNPSPGSQPNPELKENFPRGTDQNLAQSYYFQDPARYYVESQLVTFKFNGGKLTNVDVRELEQGSPDAPFQSLGMKKININEEIDKWKSRIPENVSPFDTPINIHGWAEPWVVVPIEQWDANYRKGDNTTPTGPGHFRYEDHEPYEDFVRRMNQQISEELDEAEKQKENKK